MSLSPKFQVPKHERLKLAILLSPFAILFLAIGVICGIDYLHQVHYRGSGWPIFVAIVAAVHLASSGLTYLARWHRCHSHASVQGSAVFITFSFFVLAAIVFVLVVGIH
jgi:hypothetical protein